jgi:predicted metal-dependent HD superfamily phosphohydrolase
MDKSTERELKRAIDNERLAVKIKKDWFETLQKFQTYRTSTGINNSPFSSETIVDDVIQRYSAPGRYYHTLTHIDFMLEELKATHIFLQNEDYLQLYFATIFHDVIYDIMRSADSISMSGAYASFASKVLGFDRYADTIRDLVLKTDYPSRPSQGNEEILCDIDLLILGQPRDKFRTYDTQIEMEAFFANRNNPKFTKEIYLEKRIEVLQSISRGRIYNTLYYNNGYESFAKKNIAMKIEELKEELDLSKKNL